MYVTFIVPCDDTKPVAPGELNDEHRRIPLITQLHGFSMIMAIPTNTALESEGVLNRRASLFHKVFSNTHAPVAGFIAGDVHLYAEGMAIRVEMIEYLVRVTQPVLSYLESDLAKQHLSQSTPMELCCVTCMEIRTLLTCGRCGRTRYCSKACQEQMWSFHKLLCK